MEFLFLLTLLTYLTGSILHVLFLGTGNHKVARSGYWATIAGFVFHTAFIALRWWGQGHWYDKTTFFAWAIILIYFGLSRLTRLHTIGVFVVPIAFIAILIAYPLRKGDTAVPVALQNDWLIAHVPIIFLAYAVFVAAFGFGLMYLIEEKRIREKKHTLVFNLLPALGQSDELAHKCILVGAILLTVGILIGGLWMQFYPESAMTWTDWKVVLTIATWFIYVSQLAIRQVFGWRGRKTAYSAIIGLGAILFTYIGVNLFLPSSHAFWG
jgi:ABC-type transport system involved in cytochrome c biogenesis permease subunit